MVDITATRRLEVAALQTIPLRGARQARGIGLRELERRTGLDRGHLSKIERGLVTPSLPTLRRIAGALGLKEMSRLLEPYGKDRDDAA
ncbi:MAG: helix-turn-helix domain-containing protein [Actinobacteria bacterium]|nr:helix-turn-helix domain-containing protein [Actinomycetota bacterium]